jgi:hypothetical protein
MIDAAKDTKADVRCSASIEKHDDVTSGEIRDIGADLYAEIDQLSPEELEREGAEVRKLLDWRIMPMVATLTQNIAVLHGQLTSYTFSYM